MYILPIQSYKSGIPINRNQKNTPAFSGLKNVVKPNVFDSYNPLSKDFGIYKLKVHNSDIAKRMQAVYSEQSFSKLFKFAKNKGVFNLNINSDTNFIRTTLCDPKENHLMSKLVWVTDSCRFMPILKDKYPEAAVPLMENISRYYQKQERNFNKIINDPLLFELNHDWASTAKNGIGHVFNPENMKTHKWFPHTRLDSPGLYLQSICDLITDGFNGAKYGYKSSKDVSKNSINSIANITSYLKKIVYPYAKDTGAWEEKTFDITPSSDVAIINEGFRKVINLMYSPTDNAELLKVRQRLLASKNGKIFADEKGLKEILNWGEYRIKTNSLEEVPNDRKLDAALSFIPHTEKFSDNPLDDALQIIKRMQNLENGLSDSPELVRDNGTVRYIGDRYLNMSSGHKINKDKNLSNRTEAQWFMTSDISKSYGIAVKRLLDYFEKDTSAKSAENLICLNKALSKQTEYINRAYGRVTGKNSFKANGRPCPSFQVPEAYQAVANSKGDIIFVPGTNTPLGWAQASLYDASKLMLENLKRINELI